MNILLTGGTGFIGSRLAEVIANNKNTQLTIAVRQRIVSKSYVVHRINDLDRNTDWSDVLDNQQLIIHAAAWVPDISKEADDLLAEYRRVNVDGTLNLAMQAAKAGVKRFIFISSIKVNGEQTPLDQAFTAGDTPAPESDYGISKWEAEQGLRNIALETGMETVIIRPPLVYGPRIKGNFASMIKLVESGLPLPFGNVKNQRSFVALDNLVNLIIACIDHPAASNQVFLAGDGQDLSISELFQGIAKAAEKPSRLISVPDSLLMFSASLFGKRAVAQRLLTSLRVDISKSRELIGWEPQISVEEGLRRCFQKD